MQEFPQRRRRSPYAIAFALALIMFILVAPEVNEGKAMDPTIKDGQFLVVSKTGYSQNRGIPDRGQVVIMEKTACKKVSEDNLIARVVGLPGDKVVISDGKVLVNGKEYVTPNGIRGSGGSLEVTVPEDDVFIMCDNRKVMKDSRNSKLGTVSMRDIKGDVLLKVWPFSDFGTVPDSE
ncbi:MAG: signal peptidase I [Clostridiales bacterium]|nr:signal peptidase I [Clostridiales bacterium]MDD7034866.1 signal peptidase I [Bacillota bacterium]MDY2920442.1 signal peptidase I [Lentihominibacter sp.]